VTATVDARTLSVADGDKRYRFTADCGAGTASVDADGGAISLRLLRWGEKCALARFASAGADFLAGQMLRLCADQSAEGAREAALALVLWLHAPGEPPLPMDARLLARVTLDLCQALTMPLAELALRPAPEVELLWQALGRTQAAETLPDDALTRILVLPDEAAEAIDPATPSSAAPIAASGQPEPAPAERVSNPAIPSPLAAATGADQLEPIALTESPRQSSERPRFRVRLASPPPDSLAEQSLNRVMTAAIEAARQKDATAGEAPSPRTPIRAPVSPASRGAASRTMSAAMPPSEHGGTSMPDDMDFPINLATAALARVMAAVSRTPARPATAAAEEADPDDLADRLEQAAGALGIALVE
jgi:hypothetical protein